MLYGYVINNSVTISPNLDFAYMKNDVFSHFAKFNARQIFLFIKLDRVADGVKASYLCSTFSVNRIFIAESISE